MKICWFGIYKPDFSRNRIYISGLESLGVEIVQCRDDSPGFSKWMNLIKKLKSINGEYDAIVVGYPGHIAVPLAKLFSKKPVIADLLGSLYDAEKNSHKTNFWKLLKARMTDFFAVKFADVILLESEAQKRYFEQRFGKSEKYKVLYTGSWFDIKNSYKPDIKNFTVIFRGKFTPESGGEYILEAQRLLSQYPHIHFKMGDKTHLSEEAFQAQYTGISLALGQFGDNPRLLRTIPHKTFEALSLGVPYLTGYGEAVSEIIKDGETGFLIPPANAQFLADKILFLSKNPELLLKVSLNSNNLFTTKLSSKKLAEQLLNFISSN